MAVNIGQPLAGQGNISQSENAQKVNRRQLNFDPFQSTVPTRQSENFLKKTGTFASNLTFNFLDSIMFGVPSSRLRKGMEEVDTGIWSPNRYSYGEQWDRLGIKPKEELSGADYFAYGLGQAAGFFVPFMKLSKGTTAIQRLVHGNFNQRIGEAVRKASKHLGVDSANSIETLVKARLKGQKHTIPYIYRSTPEQYNLYSESILRNISLGVTEGITQHGRRAGLTERALRSQLDETESISRAILGQIQEFGTKRMFVDNFPDMLNQFALREGAHPAMKYVTGYVGRAMDQGVNMALFDGVGRMARSAFGEPIEGIDDVPLAKSLAHSAGFAAAIAFGDFVPGGRRAGMFRDFAKFAKANLRRRRNFSQMFESKQLSEPQLRSVAAYFSTVSGKSVNRLPASRVSAGEGDPKQIASWLDSIYSTNRSDLLKAIMKDGGKSLVGSIPRAGFDAVITASYMGMSGMAIINDEALIGDYLVGAFMAMRAHQPINPRAAMRWRYNNTIDAKMSFMENMGMDVSQLKRDIPYMQQGLQEMKLHAASLQKHGSHDAIYDALYSGERYSSIDQSSTDSRSEMSAQREFINDLNTLMIPSFVDRHNINFSRGLEEINQRMLNGEIPDARNISTGDIGRIWNQIKDIKIHDNRNPDRAEGKRIGEYLNDFDSFVEAVQIPVRDFHSDMLVNSVRDIARNIDSRLIVSDDTARPRGVLTIRQFSIDSTTDHTMSNVHYFREMIDSLKDLGKVREEAGAQGAINITESSRNNIAAIDEVVGSFHENVSRELNPSFISTSSDNPSMSYIYNHRNLVIKNSFKDLITGDIRPGNEAHRKLMVTINDVIGDSVEAGRRFYVESPERDTPANESRRQAAEDLINAIADLKVGANKVRASSQDRVKSVSFDRAIGLYNTLVDGRIADVRDDGVYFGNHHQSQIYRELQARVYAETGVGEKDFISLMVLQDAAGDRSGQIVIPKDAKTLRSLVQKYYEIKTGVDADNATVTRDTEAYFRILDGLEKTKRITDAGDRYVIDENKVVDIVSALETVRMIQDSQHDGSRKELAKLSNDVADRINDVASEALNARTRFLSSRQDSDAIERLALDAESIQEAMSGLLNLKNVIPRSIADIEKFKTDIEDARRESNISKIFENFDKISHISRYSASVRDLVNVSSRSGWSYANVMNRQNIIRELIRTGDYIPEHDNMNLVELVRELGNSSNDYQTMTRVVEALRTTVRANLGISQSTIDYNSNLTVDTLREALDMTSSTEANINVASLMRRFSENPALKASFMESNSRFNDELAQKLTAEGETFRQNTTEILQRIKTELGEQDFRADGEKIVKELASAIVSINTRTETRTYLTLDGDRITLRKDDSVPRTPMLDFISSMRSKKMKLVEISNNTTGVDGRVRRFTDSGQSYSRIEASIQDAFSKVVERTSDFNEIREYLGDVRSSEDVGNRILNREAPTEALFDRPVFVDLKASDDIGVLFNLNRDSAGELLSRFRSFSNDMKRTLNRNQMDQWNPIERNIIDSLESLSRGDVTNTNTIGDLRAAVRSIYYGDHIGRDFFAAMLGESKTLDVVDVGSMSEAQQRVFKYAHHVDNTNATTLNSVVEARLSDFLSSSEVMDSFENQTNLQRVASEARRRSEEGIRVAFFDDTSITSETTIGGVIRNSVTPLLKQRGISDVEINRIVEKAIEEAGIDATSLAQGIFDGVAFTSENAMRHDSFVMGRDFDRGSRAGKISMHNVGSAEQGGLIGKMASRFDPSIAKILSKIDVDYLLPANQSKIHRGKNNFVKLENYDVSKNPGENLDGISAEMTKQVYPSETVRFMFGAHEYGSKSRTNSSVTHYWDFQALKDYSDYMGINNSVNNILTVLNSSMLSKDPSAKRNLPNLLRNKYDEIKSSGDYSHLGVMEQFIHWGLTSDSDLVRDQVVRHVRDIALTGAVAKNNVHVSNTFLFNNTELAAPIYSGTDIQRYGEAYISSGLEDVPLGANTSVVFGRAKTNDMSDIVVGYRQKSFMYKDSMRSEITSAEQGAIKHIYDIIRSSRSYGNAVELAESFNAYINIARTAPDSVAERIRADFSLSRKDVDSIISSVKTLANEGIGDIALAGNMHKIPKKFGPDSIVNRIRGFVDAQKGNITELSNFEIAMQHQADQDGDKITVYLDNPISALHTSMDSMTHGKEVVSIGSGDNRMSPNVFNLYSRQGGGDHARQDNMSRNRIDENNTLSYISNERQSKMVVGSTVKFQGVLTMLKEAGMTFPGGSRMKSLTEPNSPFARNFHYVTGSITQSVLDAWKGIHPSLLNVNGIKDFILFGDPIRNLDMDSLDSRFKAYADSGGLFGDLIRGEARTPGEAEVYRDIVKEYVKTFERVYSVFGDVYDMGTTIRPTFDTMLHVKREFDSLVNNDFTYVYRKITARKWKDSSYMNNFKKLLNVAEPGQITQRQLIHFDKESITNLRESYPQVVALDAFTTTRNGELRIDQLDAPREINARSEDFRSIFDDTARDIFSEDSNVSNLRINAKALDGIINGLENLYSSKKTLSGITAPRRLAVLEVGLENHINTLKRRRYFYEKVGHVEDADLMRSEIAHYEEQLQQVSDRVASFNSKMLEDGVVKKIEKGKYIRGTENPQYIYRIRPKKGEGVELELVGTVRPYETNKKFDFDTVALLNPIRVNDVSTRAIAEGIAFEAATLSGPMRIGDSYLQLLREAGMTSAEASRFNNEVRSMIEHAKAEIRNIDADSYDLARRVPGIKADAYDDARVYIDSMFNNIFSRIQRIAEQNKEIETHIYDAFARMLYSPRLVSSHVSKMGDYYVPYYKMDRKFVTHLTRYMKDYSGKYEVSKVLSSTDEIFSIATNLINQRDGVIGTADYFTQMNLNRKTAINSYERAKLKGNESLMESMMRLSGKDYQVKTLMEAIQNPRALINEPGSLEFIRRTPKIEKMSETCKVL